MQVNVFGSAYQPIGHVETQYPVVQSAYYVSNVHRASHFLVLLSLIVNLSYGHETTHCLEYISAKLSYD